MKRTIKYITGVALSMLVYQAGFAQTNPNTNTNQNQQNVQNQSTTVPQQTQQDLLSRYPDIDEQGVVWDNTDDGYYATYSLNEDNYMARYDAEGNWQETMQKREWNDDVPDNIKMGLNDNAYENYQVDSYWEITESDPNRNNTGYFFNLKDKDGNTRDLRMDRQGAVINENDYNDPR